MINWEKKYKDLLKTNQSQIQINKDHMRDLIEVFVNLIELRYGIVGHSRKIADHAKILAISLNFNKQDVDNIYNAALLHKIGISSFKKDIFSNKINFITKDDKEVIEQIPYVTHMALLALPFFSKISNIILYHQKRLNGTGYPETAIANDIPESAKLLAVVVDYQKIIDGIFLDEHVKPAEAKQFLKEHVNIYYDEHIVDRFLQILKLEENQVMRTEQKISVARLEPGMILSRAVTNHRGFLLLPKHLEITEDILESIDKYIATSKEELDFFIKKGKIGRDLNNEN